MKKKIQLFVLLCTLIIIGCAMYEYEEARIIWHVDENNAMELTLVQGEEQRNLYPWWDETEKTYYFFLPSFTDDEDIYLSTRLKNKIFRDGKEIKNGHEITWNQGQVYEIRIENKSSDRSTSLKVAFERSANIPAAFIDTNSGSMESIHQDKENEEKGYLSILDSDGTEDYSGALKKISGRGNTSWGYGKKPYTIKLNKAASLCDMDAGEAWCLLADFRDGTKLQNKLAFDLATEMGMGYVSQSTWVDLYINGEYAGNYLLCEPVTVGEGRVEINDLDKENAELNAQIKQSSTFVEADYKGYEIKNSSEASGGYLLERDTPWYYEMEQSGFVLQSGNCFAFTAPKYISEEQILYMKEYMQNIENMIIAKDTNYYDYIDMDSFVSRFLVDEITLNIDACQSSMFFYKEKDDNKLYAGPVWDYDTSMGNAKREFLGDDYLDWTDYKWSTLSLSRGGLNWYQYLYQDPLFYQTMLQKYQATLPYLDDVLANKIDEYANTIRASVNMDMIRWKNEYNSLGWIPGESESFDENVKYLKTFLTNRLTYLNETWKGTEK